MDPILFDDPSAHQAACLYGQWLLQRQALAESGDLDRTTSFDPPEQDGPIHIHGSARSTNQPVSGCPCQAILADEAKSFEEEAQGYPAGSPENTALLMHGEFLKQLVQRIAVRKKFTAMVQS
jgi:hypothetical protein